MSPLFSTSAGATIRAYGMRMATGIANFFWAGYAKDSFGTTDSFNATSAIDSEGSLWVTYTAGSSSFQPDIIKINNKGVLQTRYSNGNNMQNTFMPAIASDNSPIFCWPRTSSTDVDIAKFNPSTYAKTWWANTYYATGVSAYSRPTVDTSDNIFYCMGYSSGMNIVKVDTSGNLQAQKTIPFVSGAGAASITVAPNGSVWTYTAGDSLIIWNNALTSFTYGNTGLLSSGGDANGRQTMIGHDSSSNGYLAGSTTTGYVMKWNSTGTAQWGKSFSFGSTYMGAIAVDSSGNSYAAFTPQTSGTSTLFYVLKFDSSGNIVWQRQMTSTGVNYRGYPPISITLDSLNAMIITLSGGSSSSRHGLVFKLPVDGTKTGSFSAYDTYTYSASSLTIASATPSNIASSSGSSNSSMSYSLGIGGTPFNAGTGQSFTATTIT